MADRTIITRAHLYDKPSQPGAEGYEENYPGIPTGSRHTLPAEDAARLVKAGLADYADDHHDGTAPLIQSAEQLGEQPRGQGQQLQVPEPQKRAAAIASGGRSEGDLAAGKGNGA